MKPASQFAGRRFGRVVVERRLFPNIGGNTNWACLCDCGNRIEVIAVNLRRGRTQSCGCLQRHRAREANTTHGMCNTKVYGIWSGMIRRCSDHNHQDFHRYGGRGITVCARWSHFESFYEDMGTPPTGLTIERRDNEQGYSPSNCRWASRKEQGRNTATVIWVEIDGERLTLREAAIRRGLRPGTVYQRRFRGATLDQALTP